MPRIKQRLMQKIDIHFFLKSKWLMPIICGLFGILVFLLIFGSKVLNPYYIDYILVKGEDLSQHLIGFLAYLHNGMADGIKSMGYSINFPLAMTDALLFPDNFSILTTDANPFFSIIFKGLSFLFSSDFQFDGIFGLCVFFLQGFSIALILQYWIKNKFVLFLCSLLLFFTMPMFWRIFAHHSLSAQFLILLPISYILYSYKKEDNIKNDCVFFGIITSIACMIFLYFMPMILIMLFFYTLYKILLYRNLKYIFPLIFSLLISILTIYSIGAFYNSESSFGGLAFYIANLNTFFNPVYSPFFEKLPDFPGQYEGWAYLGIGNIILIFIALAIFLYQYCKNFNNRNMYTSIKDFVFKNIAQICVVLCIITFFIMMTGLKFTFNNAVLFQIHINESSIIGKLLGAFRSNGRFAWVVMYLVIIFSISFLYKWCINRSRRVKIIAICILSSVVVLQVYEIYPLMKKKYDFFKKDHKYQKFITPEICDVLKNNGIKFVVTPEFLQPVEAYNFISCGLPVTNFYFSRPPLKLIEKNHKAFNKIFFDGIEGSSIGDKFKNFNSNDFVIAYKKNGFIISSYVNIYEVGPLLLLSHFEIDGLSSIEDNTLNLMLKDKFLYNGKYDKDAKSRVLFPEGVSFGPYALVEKGRYKLVVNGNNLKNLIFDAFSGSENKSGYINFYKHTEEEVRATIDFPITSIDWEIRYRNKGKNDAVVTSIELRPIHNKEEMVYILSKENILNFISNKYGWSGNEGSHIWSVGKELTLPIYHTPKNDNNKLVLKLIAYLDKICPEQNIIISANRKELRKAKFDSVKNEQIVEIDIPKDLFKDSFIELKIDLLNEVSTPANLGSGDSRTLGIALSDIYFE